MHSDPGADALRQAYAASDTTPLNVTAKMEELPKVWYRYGDSNPGPVAEKADHRLPGASIHPVSSGFSRRTFRPLWLIS